MKEIVFSALVVGALSLCAATVARAQESDVVQVPFSFIAGGKVLPAGTYRLSEKIEDRAIVQVSGADGGAFVVTNSAGTRSGEHARLLFKTFHGQKFLWQIAVPGSEVREVALHDSTMQQMLVKLNLNPAEPVGSPAR